MKTVKSIHPEIKPRTYYKVKNAKKEFLCALCEAPRGLRYHSHLQGYHYQQIAVISACLAFLFIDLINWKIVFIPFIVWMAYELIYKALYRKDLACPYCGFDPTWYRRDVKLARAKVEEYIKTKGLEPGHVEVRWQQVKDKEGQSTDNAAPRVATAETTSDSVPPQI